MKFISFAFLAAVAAMISFGMDVPRPAPPLVVKTPVGGTIDLASYKGKVVALEFLITTCPHCQNCSRILQKMQVEYGPKGFQALGVATNDMANMLVPDYVRSLGLSFPVGFAGREVAHEFLQHPMMLIMYMPQLVFIDRAGVIRAHYPGGDKFFQDEEKNVRAQIESLLKEPARRAPAGKAPASKAPATKKAAAKQG